MADMNDRISPADGLVGGDHFNVRRTVTDLPNARTVVRAWMTAKLSRSDPDDEAAFQKEITSSDVPTVGVIEDPGSGTGSDRQAVLLFRLQPADTQPVSGSTHHFDVQVKLDDDSVHTPFVGKIKAEEGLTVDTSA